MNKRSEEKIRVIITGGTFDKQYDPLKGELTFKETHLDRILEQARLTVETGLEINQLKDSLDMKDECRLKILDACRKAPEKRIIITHGTDTMVDTARVIGRAQLDKCVVFTGAMVPYSVAGSDSLFNLGFAFCAVQHCNPGVYIAMSGRVFPWNKVKKDRERGVFVEAVSGGATFT